MPVTVNDVYLAAMALCDYTDGSGAVPQNERNTALLAKSPYLCYAATHELTASKGISTALEIACGSNPDAVTGDESLYEIPEFLSLISLCLPSDYDGTGSNHRFYIKGGYLYTPKDYCGNIRIFYRKKPKRLTRPQSLLETREDLSLGVIPFYLAADFLLEENPERSALYLSRYELDKNTYLSLKELSQSRIESIENVY